jgi:hypothetical protein
MVNMPEFATPFLLTAPAVVSRLDESGVKH